MSVHRTIEEVVQLTAEEIADEFCELSANGAAEALMKMAREVNYSWSPADRVSHWQGVGRTLPGAGQSVRNEVVLMLRAMADQIEAPHG